VSYFQQAQKISVPGAGSATFTLRIQAPIDRLTIWAVSGTRTITNMSFQAQINGRNFRAAVPIAAAVAAHLIYQSGGGTVDNLLIPFNAHNAATGTPDPFVFTIAISNAHGSAEEVTLYASGLAT
jgi:hypothetical protein